MELLNTPVYPVQLFVYRMFWMDTRPAGLLRMLIIDGLASLSPKTHIKKVSGSPY